MLVPLRLQVASLSPEAGLPGAVSPMIACLSAAAHMAMQVTLKRAFDGQSLPALVVKILRGRYPPVPTQYSSSLRGLVDNLLKQKPQVLPAGPANPAAFLKGINQRVLFRSWSACPSFCCKAWCLTTMNGCAQQRPLLHAACCMPLAEYSSERGCTGAGAAIGAAAASAALCSSLC